MSDTGFDPGEIEHLRWTISWRAFALRSAFLVLVTPLIVSPMLLIALILGGVTFGTLRDWAVALPFALFLTWVFGDFSIWSRNKRSEWIVTNRAIHVLNKDEFDTKLPLSAIRQINRWPLWSLVVRLQGGTAVTLPLVPDIRATRDTILSLRDNTIEAPQ